MLTGALRSDSAGNRYVRANASVNGRDAEVVIYGRDAMYDCETGYQVLPDLTQGDFNYDPKNPGDPWTSWRSAG